MEALAPPLVILLGLTALRAVLGRADLDAVHGTVLEVEGRRYLPTYHPSAAMRFPRVRERMAADLAVAARVLREAGGGGENVRVSRSRA